MRGKRFGSGLGLAVVMAAIVGCGDTADNSQGACAASLTWRGATYIGVSLSRKATPAVGRRVGTGTIPPCIDTSPPPDPPEKAERIALRRIKGVSPRIAVYADGLVWPAFGFFTELPSHPLHRAFHGSRQGVPNFTREGRCRGMRTIRGLVTTTQFGPVDINPLGKARSLSLRIDAITRIRGFSKAGHPYLERGDEIRVRGLRCRPTPESGFPSRFLLARTIRPAD